MAYRSVGKSLPRIDAVGKVTGNGPIAPAHLAHGVATNETGQVFPVLVVAVALKPLRELLVELRRARKTI